MIGLVWFKDLHDDECHHVCEISTDEWKLLSGGRPSPIPCDLSDNPAQEALYESLLDRENKYGDLKEAEIKAIPHVVEVF